jgi:hypothetical protein
VELKNGEVDMSLPADVSQNINIIPIPVERVVETPKAEPGNNNVDNSALEMKEKKSEGPKEIDKDESRQKRKAKKDTYKHRDSDSEETDEGNITRVENHLTYEKQDHNVKSNSPEGHIIDIVG